MMLDNKVAVIYGGGGSIGGAAAKAFAREGAQVFLSGRSQGSLDKVADAIRSVGGKVETAIVDALDEESVDAFVEGVITKAGRIDISLNVIGVGDVQKPLMDITTDEFLQPIQNAMRTQFLTTRAAARHMITQGGGVVLAFGGNGTQTIAGLGGFKVSLDATEGLRRQWAAELSQYGIRILTLKTGGVPESIADEKMRAEIEPMILKDAPMKRVATLADVGNVLAFVASDLGRTITNTEVNISCGALVD